MKGLVDSGDQIYQADWRHPSYFTQTEYFFGVIDKKLLIDILAKSPPGSLHTVFISNIKVSFNW